ncbi:MAG: lipopolysaccharide assembly protein LapA domain-containing protein [Pseudomonadota bacterium]
MRALRWLGWLTTGLVALILGIWLVQDNSADTRVVLLGFSIGSLPLGIWLALAFLTGVLAATLATLPVVAGTRLRMRRLQRELGRRSTVQ